MVRYSCLYNKTYYNGYSQVFHHLEKISLFPNNGMDWIGLRRLTKQLVKASYLGPM